MKTYSNFGIYDFSDFAEELDEELLFTVNGGTNYGQCGGGASAPTIQPPSPPSNTNQQPTPDIPTPTSPTPTTTVTATCSGGSDPSKSLSEQVKELIEKYNDLNNVKSRNNADNHWNDWMEKAYNECKFTTVAECGGPVVQFLTQRVFSAFYSTVFGNHACCATSLLNELSEQYSRENCTTASITDLIKAMEKAVDEAGVSAYDASVINWDRATKAMSESLGLKGTYSYTEDKSKADAVLIWVDTKTSFRDYDGKGDHFVNDIGGGKYFDPYSGTTGDIKDLHIAYDFSDSKIKSAYRYFDYQR